MTITVQPSGDYATINIEKTLELIELLNDDSVSTQKKSRVIEEIYLHPGSYNPVVLCTAGTHFLAQKEIQKAALLYVGGLYRAQIDVSIISIIDDDQSVNGTPSILKGNIDGIVDLYLKTKKESDAWNEAKLQAVQNFESWDRSTPKEYDDRWPRLQSIRVFTEFSGGTARPFKEIKKEAKLKITERYYQTMRGEPLREDLQDVDPTQDEYYLDVQTKIFHHRESGLSFLVPQTITPSMNIKGKYKGLMNISDSGYLVIKASCSDADQSLESKYLDARSNNQAYEDDDYKESAHTIERITTGHKTPGYKESYTCSYKGSPQVFVTQFCFVKGHYSFDLEMRCEVEFKDICLESLKPLIDSVQFQNH